MPAAGITWGFNIDVFRDDDKRPGRNYCCNIVFSEDRHPLRIWCGRLFWIALPRHGKLIALGKVRETRDIGLELQGHGAGRAVALLADDDLGFAVDLFHLRLPLEMVLGAGAW